MEVCIPNNKPPRLYMSSTNGSPIEPSSSANFRSGDLPVNDLEIYVSNFLSIEDTEISTAGFNISPGTSNKSKVVREDNCKDLGNRKSSNLTSEKFFNDCVANPALSVPKSALNGLSSDEKVQKDDKASEASDVNNGAVSAGRCYSRLALQPMFNWALVELHCCCVQSCYVSWNGKPLDSIPGLRLVFVAYIHVRLHVLVKILSTVVFFISEFGTIISQTPLELVSAMKGSREKQGIAPKKLAVTWALDVYDPTPTAVSHVPSHKNQYYRSNGKKYSKNKRKGGGKSSQGRRAKDKKQAQKNSGGPTKSKPLHDDAVVVDVSEPYVGDFNVAGPDAFCGSSFLKKSVKNLHFPVTEAK